MGRDRGIVVEGRVREFKNGPRAVDGIDLRVEPGEVYGFLGPNGAGKSTTVLMLTTLLPPTGGTARVAGYDIVKEGPQVRASIGAALQEAALDPFLTGREHLNLQAALHGIPRAERKKRGNALLERVGLQEAADRRVRGYSGGMKRRLDLARARVHEPSILFLAEPTTGLDPQSRSALWSEVSRLARDEGVTVFLTTQYLEEADVLADRVGIIDRGRIVSEDTPEALKAEIGRPSVEATPASPAERDAVVGILSRFGEESPSQPGTVAVRLSGGASGLADVVRALDAENLNMQSALHGIPRAERKKRGNALLERVGLQEAADRRVRGYSGGMKRRLDLALALVHEPSILFLDEPTTGLDPQSRSALWSEVSRLARDEGVPVFLTTQYLEEADVLADRVGIIDRGRIVAEDTPEALKAEIGRPSVEATPASPGERDAVVNVLSRFGEEIPSQPGTVAVRLSGGASGLADVVRALDAENLKVNNLRLEEPSLDDVFLAKTGRSLEGAGDGGENEAEEAQG